MLKTVSSITNAIGALNYKGTWDANTNSPDLSALAAQKGDYYVVSVAGSTSLGGISTWYVGDWAVYNGAAWQRVEGGTDDPAPSLKSNSTTGLMQITGPAAGQTRVVTIPDANSTMARTDAAQTFTGNQTVSNGDLILGTNAKALKDASGVEIVKGATTTLGNVTLTDNQQFASPTGALFGLGKAFAVQTFKTNGNQTSITVTCTRQSGILMFGATWSGGGASTLGGCYFIQCGDSAVNATLISQSNSGGFGNATVTTSGFDITITLPGGSTGSITGCFVGTAVA